MTESTRKRQATSANSYKRTMVKKNFEKNVKYYTKNLHSVKYYTIFAMLNKTSKQYEKRNHR